jgi:hypothetical protein
VSGRDGDGQQLRCPKFVRHRLTIRLQACDMDLNGPDRPFPALVDGAATGEACRILVLDAGRTGMRKARGVVAELPRSTRLGRPGTGLWHQIAVGSEILRVHRRFFADIETSDATMADAILADAATAAA